MAASKLTAATVTTLAYTPSPSGWCVVWHRKLKGFGLRITAHGARSYVVKFRLRGSCSTRLRTIGTPTKYTFCEAHEVARRALRDAELGIDYLESIKRERRKDLQRRRRGRRAPRNVGAVDHRVAFMERVDRRLRAQDEAGNFGLAPQLLGEMLIDADA